jgi:hypothetical protein
MPAHPSRYHGANKFIGKEGKLMVFYSTIFPQIDNALKDAKMSRRELSKKSCIKYDTLGYKLRGESEFTRPEMYRIKEVFNLELSGKLFLDDLFTTGSDDSRDSA